MTTIVSYNILAGGYNVRDNNTRRTEQLATIIRSAQPDIVGLVEATHPMIQQKPLVIEELAAMLNMNLIMGAPPRFSSDYQLALLTRLPVIHTQTYRHPSLNRPLFEVCIEDTNGQQFTVFVTHLTASFSQGRGGGGIRYREVQEILRFMAPARTQGTPHILMGDFNSLAPGDSLRASELVRYVVNLDHEKHQKPEKYDPSKADGHPHLNFVVPPQLRFFNPMLRIIPRSRWLSALLNAAASIYAPRSSIQLLLEAGYVDCYRRIHPHTRGFTCPAAAPAGRIDFILASPQMAARLETCYVLTDGDGLPGSAASDHLAVAAEFGSGVLQKSTTAAFADNEVPS